MTSKLRRVVASVLGLTLLLVGCSDDTEQVSGEAARALAFIEDYDRSEPAALIGAATIDSEWMFALVEEILTVRDPDGSLTGAARAIEFKDLFRQMLSAAVVTEVIANLAQENGVAALTDADIDAEVDQARQRLGGNDAFLQMLTESGVTLTVYRDILVPWELYQQRLEAVLRGSYEPMEFVEVRHILVETEDEATDIYNRITAGEAFGAIAEELSLDTLSGQDGGYLGPSERGRFVTGFEEVVWLAAIGELLGPLQTEFGFHVAEVLDVRVYTADELDEVTEERLLVTKLRDLMNQKIETITIVINPKVGYWDTQQGVIVPF